MNAKLERAIAVSSRPHVFRAESFLDCEIYVKVAESLFRDSASNERGRAEGKAPAESSGERQYLQLLERMALLLQRVD